MAEITNTFTVQEVTITNSFDVAARGPAGSDGDPSTLLASDNNWAGTNTFNDSIYVAGEQYAYGDLYISSPIISFSNSADARFRTALGLGSLATVSNLTGVVTSTGAATAIADSALSIAKTSGLQTALDAKQPYSIGFLERFGRYANAATVANGSTPEFGGNAFIHWGAGSALPTITNRALEAASGTLIYYGQTVQNTNARFSLLLMAEVRINSSYTSGSTNPDLTIGVNGKPFDNLSSFLNTPQCLHAQIRPNGIVGASFYSEGTDPPADDGGTGIYGFPVNKKFPIFMVVERGECRISALGVTRVFRDSRYLDRITNISQTGFFVEWAAPDTATKYYWAIHSIAANCPQYEQEVMFFGGSAGDQGGLLTSRDTVTIQGRLRAAEENGSSSYVSQQTPQSTDNFAFPGRGMLGYNPYFRPSPSLTSYLPGIIEINGTILTSSASAADQSLKVFSYLENLLVTNGEYIKYSMHGRFGANANTKRIKLGRDPSVVHFDSGNITTDYTGLLPTFTIESTVYRVGGVVRHHTVMTYGPAAADSVQRIQSGTVNTAASQRFYVTGTTASDVTLDYYTIEMLKF